MNGDISLNEAVDFFRAMGFVVMTDADLGMGSESVGEEDEDESPDEGNPADD